MFEIPRIRSSIFFLFFLVWAISSSSALALTDDEKNNVAIYQKVSPSVVNVISSVITRDFFLNPVPREGSGSGSVIDSKGYILTNNHVIKDAQKLEVTLADGSKWPAKLIGADPDNDLAVIKLDAPASKLKPLPWSDSQKLQVGRRFWPSGIPSVSASPSRLASSALWGEPFAPKWEPKSRM